MLYQSIVFKTLECEKECFFFCFVFVFGVCDVITSVLYFILLSDQVNFGHVTISADFEPPAELSLGQLGFRPRVHNVHARDVIIINNRQISLVELDYDGNGPGELLEIKPKTMVLPIYAVWFLIIYLHICQRILLVQLLQ